MVTQQFFPSKPPVPEFESYSDDVAASPLDIPTYNDHVNKDGTSVFGKPITD